MTLGPKTEAQSRDGKRPSRYYYWEGLFMFTESCRLHRGASSCDQVEQEHDNRDHEQEVYQSTADVPDETEKP